MATTTTTAPIATAPITAAPAVPVISPERHQSTLETRIEAALEHARRLTQMNGTDNIDTAIAWETVEELQKAHNAQPATSRSAFESYCAANPDAPECRIYES